MIPLKSIAKFAIRRAVVIPARIFARASKYGGVQFLGSKAYAVPEYYTPVPDPADLTPDYWDREISLQGIMIDENYARSLMTEIFPPFLTEFRDRFSIHKDKSKSPFHLINGSYMAVDAHAYYGLVRHLKPRHIVEIGVGNSTHVAQAAIEANRREGAAGRLTAIEPYLTHRTQGYDPDIVTIVEKKVQAVPVSFFEELEAGDILFIDSSHVLREGNDVLYEYLEILPRLKPGVYVHVHDISLPRRYPQVYCDNGLFWNEQYLLHAYLMHNSKTEVIWPGNFMLLRHEKEMHETFPEIAIMRESYPMSEATAFWFRTL